MKPYEASEAEIEPTSNSNYRGINEKKTELIRNFIIPITYIGYRGFMKIEHVAIWAKDIDKVCEFYRKYFGGVVQPLYHNPTKQFTSKFITFDDGARLEIMHRPDISYCRSSIMPETQDTEYLGFTHLSFSVGSKENVNHLTQQMSDDGVTIVGQPRTTGDGYYESVVLDPERNRIEITV